MVTETGIRTYWDTSLVEAAPRGQPETVTVKVWAAEMPKAPLNAPQFAAEWAAESNQLARRTAYRFEGFACKAKHQSFAADDAYDAMGVATVKEQIVMAGRRLAMTLNAVFD